MEWSQTESVWNDHERLLLDALTDWEENLHTCGRQLSESLSRRLEGVPDPEYTVANQECVACKALDQFWANRAKEWKKAHEDGRHPERYTLPQVYLRSEAEELAKQRKG